VKRRRIVTPSTRRPTSPTSLIRASYERTESAGSRWPLDRERLAAGESPEQVKAYFVEKYGLWILLAPPRQGFNLLVWVVPFVALGAGLVLVFIVIFAVARGEFRDTERLVAVPPPTRPHSSPLFSWTHFLWWFRRQSHLDGRSGCRLHLRSSTAGRRDRWPRS